MRPLIYLVGTNASKATMISDLLDSSCDVKRVSKSALVTAFYQEKPHCLVIIESDFDSDSLMAMGLMISLEYTPTICISFDRHPVDVVKHIEGASYVTDKALEHVLLPLVEQACQFSSCYNALHVSYDTYEIMNVELREAMDIYMDPRTNYSGRGIAQYFDRVYRGNIFLDKYPSKIWFIKEVAPHQYHGYLYDVESTHLIKDLLYEDKDFSFERYNETGFFKNCDSGELSDIDDLEQLLPKAIRTATGAVGNVACFANQNVMLISLDYNGHIEQLDLNILKALTIKTDLMVAIKNQVTALEDAFIYTMNALARAAEGKDDVTGDHIKRVNLYAGFIARALDMEKDFVQQVEIAAQMHDVGKILVPDDILNKPGKLTDEEYALMQQHTLFGVRVIGESDHLTMAASIARSHHERYDGTGYPEGLKGDAIPIEARIVAMADVYDALRSPRPYKRGFTHEEAFHIITVGDGRVEPHHFDPDVLRVFEENHEAFREMYDALKDPE